jgi:tetratricopeptide (TPR) repeat protein
MGNWKLNLLWVLILVIFSCNRYSKENKNKTGSIKWSDTTEILRLLQKNETHNYLQEDSILIDLKQARDLSEKVGFLKGIIRSDYQKALEFLRLKRYEDAQVLLELLLKTARSNQDRLLEARCLKNLGVINFETRNEYKALDFFFKSLSVFEEIDVREELANVYNYIGGLKSQFAEYQLAEEYFLKSKSINEELGDSLKVLHNESNLAFAYQMQGDLKKANFIYNEIVPKYGLLGDFKNLSAIYAYMSINYQIQNQLDSALFFISKSIQLSEKIQDSSALVSSYGIAGNLYIEQQQFDSAVYYLNKTIDKAILYDDYFTQKQAFRLLLSIDTLRGDFENATRKLEAILILNDSDFSKQMRNSSQAISLKYENERKENQIKLQTIQLNATNSQKKFWISISTISFLLFLSLVVLFVFIRRNSIKKHELLNKKLKLHELELKAANVEREVNRLKMENSEKQLKINEKEQLSNALAIEQKNQLFQMIGQRINESVNEEGSINRTDLNDILSSIKLQLTESSDSNLFNQKFNAIHSDFFKQLKEKHPSLTKSEVKFCAFLKIHLDGKQIAKILNISPEGIRKIRYRIRKKIELKPEESLEDYILSI